MTYSFNNGGNVGAALASDARAGMGGTVVGGMADYRDPAARPHSPYYNSTQRPPAYPAQGFGGSTSTLPPYPVAAKRCE